MIYIYGRGQKEKLSDYFNSSEFDCLCGNCGLTYIDERLVSRLSKIRDVLKRPIVIESGFRCRNHQEFLMTQDKIKTVKNSMHLYGRAVDFKCGTKDTGFLSGQFLYTEARRAGFYAIGVASNWIHVDTRDDKLRNWVY